MTDSQAIVGTDIADEPARCLQDVEDWTLTEGKTLPLRQLIPGFCQRLIEAGAPIERCNIFIRQLHPQYYSRGFIWTRGDSIAQESSREHGIERTPLYLDSPMYRIYEFGEDVRRRLLDPATPRDFPVLNDLAEKGMTDYFACPLPFRRGAGQAITLATQHPQGFSEEDIALIKGALPAFATVAELINHQRMAQTVLQTYIGQSTGQRVVDGRIQRGDVTSIRAVLMFSDLRGFTELSESLPGEAVIDLLNDYFETISEPLTAIGGEILKFIGDAVLAILPVDGDGEANLRDACNAALVAAETAISAIAVNTKQRERIGHTPYRAGLALHVGEVLYGNIGTQDRLDFTVIGPAVNLVSRIEGLCAQNDHPIVLSADFARYLSTPLTSLGEHKLKGIAQPQEVFAPA